MPSDGNQSTVTKYDKRMARSVGLTWKLQMPS